MTYTMDSLKQAGYAVLRGERVFIERVIERAYTDQVSIFHAAHLVAVDDGTARGECGCTPCSRARGASF